MPRYFFDTFDGETWIEDTEGVECDGPGAAQAEAQTALADIAKDETPDGDRRVMTVRVRDEDGPLLEANLDLRCVW